MALLWGFAADEKAALARMFVRLPRVEEAFNTYPLADFRLGGHAVMQVEALASEDAAKPRD